MLDCEIYGNVNMRYLLETLHTHERSKNIVAVTNASVRNAGTAVLLL